VTALFAVFLALGKFTESYFLALFLFVLTGVSAALIYLNRRERQQQAVLEAKKSEFRVQQKAYRDEQARRGLAHEQTDLLPTDRQITGDVDGAGQRAAAEQDQFRLSFSLKQLMIAMTVAAVLFAFTFYWFTPAYTALALGLVALAGLVVVTAGFEPPRVVVLGWWLLLMLYVLVSILAVFWQVGSLK
jgi:hypothetical protein